jgi:hypothetical protein
MRWWMPSGFRECSRRGAKNERFERRRYHRDYEADDPKQLRLPLAD